MTHSYDPKCLCDRCNLKEVSIAENIRRETANLPWLEKPIETKPLKWYTKAGE